MLPKVKGKELELFEIRDVDSDVSPGAWGIPEPQGSALVKPDELDVIIVPGAAFDEQGNRLGYPFWSHRRGHHEGGASGEGTAGKSGEGPHGTHKDRERDQQQNAQLPRHIPIASQPAFSGSSV